MATTDTTAAAISNIELPNQSYRSGKNAFHAGFADLKNGFSNFGLWRELAWEDFVKRYRRAYFGALWASASFAIFAIAILFFVASVSGGSAAATTSYVVLGYLVFQLLSSLIIDGANVFVTSANWLKSTRLPLSLFVFKDVARNLIVFVFNLLGAAGLLIWAGYRLPEGSYWALAGIAAIIGNSIWIYLFLGVVVSRFRDLFHLINAIMRMAFFLSPIMWMPGEKGIRSAIAIFNPITHFIQITRQPLLDGSIPVFSWIVVGCISAVGTVTALIVFCLLRRRVIFWV